MTILVEFYCVIIGVRMLKRITRRQHELKPKVFRIRWYPNNRSCISGEGRRVKANQMPPLMVRKAEWRR